MRWSKMRSLPLLWWTVGQKIAKAIHWLWKINSLLFLNKSIWIVLFDCAHMLCCKRPEHKYFDQCDRHFGLYLKLLYLLLLVGFQQDSFSKLIQYWETHFLHKSAVWYKCLDPFRFLSHGDLKALWSTDCLSVIQDKSTTKNDLLLHRSCS